MLNLLSQGEGSHASKEMSAFLSNVLLAIWGIAMIVYYFLSEILATV
jgi:hypothetical protein